MQIKKIISTTILLTFLLTSVCPTTSVWANKPLLTPFPKEIISLSSSFNPPVLKGLKIYPNNPFHLDFILDQGEEKLTNQEKKSDSVRLIKYFLAALTTPEKDLWVNLSPYEKNHIIPKAFGQTDMGKDLLKQDYLLKQITTTLLHPDNINGKKFWSKIYASAKEKYGTTDIPIDTFNKVWIVPEKTTIYENVSAKTVYITEAKLTVMLEKDYLAGKKNASITNSTPDIAQEIMRAIIIPELEQEINEGKNFSQLRQIYQSLVLASWYKYKIKNSLLSAIYVNRNKISGININDTKACEEIWSQYLKIFKEGSYNIIKEDTDTLSGEAIPRKYFSGGVSFQMHKLINIVHSFPQEISIDNSQTHQKKLNIIEVDLQPTNANTKPHFFIHIARFDYEAGNTERKDIYLEMLNISDYLLTKLPPSKLLEFIQNATGNPNLNLSILGQHVVVSFAGDGAHKNVYKVRFMKKNEPGFIEIIFAVKKAHKKNDISNFEMADLKKLNGQGVPKWGGAFTDDTGKTVFVEEFIDGKTVFQYAQKTALNSNLRKKVIDTLLTVTAGLSGRAPKDFHKKNFIIQKKSQDTIMVDIGDRRLDIFSKGALVRHQLLFLAILLAEYGARDIPDNFVFFDSITSHPALKNGYGLKMLQDVLAYINTAPESETLKYLHKAGRQLLWHAATPGSSGHEMLSTFLQFVKTNIEGYLNTITSPAKTADFAMIPEDIKESPDLKGGIDLSKNTLNFQTKDGSIKFNIDANNLRQIQNTTGLSPVIINIQPLRNLELFLNPPS